jgi:hypothetical protein
MMMKQAKLMATMALAACASVSFGQAYLAESQAAINMNNTIQSQPGMAPPVPGQLPGVQNPGAGFGAPGMGGNTMPGGMPGGVNGAEVGMEGLNGQTPGFTPPPPINTESVYTGRRVFDAVSGALLEDAVEITVRQEDVAAYDNGTNDNGLVGDGKKGNVITSRNEFIGQFSNLVKNELIHAVHNAEQIDPMVYFGHHVAKINPTETEGLKRYGRPLSEEADGGSVQMVNAEPDFASIINLEEDRDNLVRRWNDKFLAKYRTNPQDPQSEYFAVFVPSPPLTPANYPVPTGYVAPQAVAKAQEKQLDAEAATLAAAAAASNVRGGQMGAPDLGGTTGMAPPTAPAGFAPPGATGAAATGF